MDLHLNNDDARVLQEVLEERVSQLDHQIAAADNHRFKQQLLDIEHSVERVLGAVRSATTSPGGPDEWERRDEVSDDASDTDLGHS